MKHLKLFESFNLEDIDAICQKYNIGNYTINEDGSIDVNGSVYFYLRDLSNLPPLKFRNVTGDFDCRDNKLTTLKGSPITVGGNFRCVGNLLTSLKDAPESVGGNFYCHYNALTSIEGAPKSIGDNFDCSYNKLTSLEGCPKSIGLDIDCRHNKIVTFEHLPYSIGGDFLCFGNPIDKIWYLFDEDYSKIEFLNDCDALREPETVSEEPIIILDRLNFFLEEIGEKTVTEVKGYKCI